MRILIPFVSIHRTIWWKNQSNTMRHKVVTAGFVVQLQQVYDAKKHQAGKKRKDFGIFRLLALPRRPPKESPSYGWIQYSSPWLAEQKLLE